MTRPLPPGSIPAVPILGAGGSGYEQTPGRMNQVPNSAWMPRERAGAGAPGARGLPRTDPMLIASGDLITRPSGLFPSGDRVTVNGFGQNGAERRPIEVISGPPILDPSERVLVPEHQDEYGNLVPAHWTYRPYSAMRLRVVVPGEGEYPVDQAVGAIVRVEGSSPFGGAVVSREFILTPSMEACFMAGKYAHWKVSLLAMTGDTQLAWEWFNDTSGLCGLTELWTEVYQATYNQRFNVPEGAIKAFFDDAAFIGWQIWDGGVGTNNLIPFDRSSTTVASVPGEGTPVHGQSILPVATGGGSGGSFVNVQFRLSPI